MTELRVDLDALEANIDAVRGAVGAAELMLVVKDDAYGHGLGPVSRRAHDAGVRWFGAYDIETGSELRRALGPGIRIFVWMAASGEAMERAVAHDLDIGIGDAETLEAVAQAGARSGRAARVHLKIDTGLHRNGVRPEEWPQFVRRAREHEIAGRIEMIGVWSHIAEASDAEDDLARSAFDEAVHEASAAGLRPRLRHLSASAASLARPEFRYDLVRVGAFCFGIRPAGGPSEAELGIRPIAALQAPVTSVDGDRATVGIGRLDGLPSTLAGRVSVGTPAGPRSLLEVGADSTVENWPGAAPGDVVTIWGPGEQQEGSATDLAEAIGTIGEELAVRVSPLVPRSYVGE
ncbi:alanine racemase [Microbacterium sp. Root166]|uniref:alanine racemase n=1 Tax=Microbacterium sp. Root166 TaxID=1736478 RepID=UPI0006FA2308|nr:alanine racemase [Microbacterium sp. Root166]KQZ84220.1 alanine racemase [Microbacterium sp. Root166]